MIATMRLPAADRELVQIMDASLARAAEQAGEWLACRPGCTQCCYGAFAINQLDAARLRAGMEALRAAEPMRAEAIEKRARAWIAGYGPDFPGDKETGRLGESVAEREGFEEFATEAACPALDPATGLCGVYEWRPMTCRVFGPPVRMAGEEDAEGLGHCELCFNGATPEQVAGCEMPVPHELEARLLEEVGAKGETLVAWALVR
ncbi:MAG: YkgJ family cysteine cluster protein [Terracidiphilus sp.]